LLYIGISINSSKFLDKVMFNALPMTLAFLLAAIVWSHIIV
jgi:hypothetical protein